MQPTRKTRNEHSSGGVVIAVRDGAAARRAHRHAQQDALGTAERRGRSEGETSEAAALREVREETGLEARIVRPLDTIEYFFRAGDTLIQKRVDFYLMEYVAGELEPQLSEVDDVRVGRAERRRCSARASSPSGSCSRWRCRIVSPQPSSSSTASSPVFVGFVALSRAAIVGALRDAAFRLLTQTFSGPTSSTSWFETTERGATSVTSTFSFANSSRCLSSSHSLPLSDFPRPLMRTSAHSPNIFFPYSRNVSFPDFSAFDRIVARLDELPRPVVPDDHVPRAVVPRRDHALERRVVVRMILGHHRQALRAAGRTTDLSAPPTTSARPPSPGGSRSGDARR